jgi:uncharacterized membrane protein (UPF0127 family)
VPRWALAVVLSSAALACGEKPEPAADEHVISFDTATARVIHQNDTTRLSLELARTSAQKTMGLMERRQLAETAGMLFLYDSTQSKDAAFWMYRTRIPLDIAFLDSAGTIRSIVSMVPCTATLIEGCPNYPPGAPYRYALEMNAGFFARKSIVAGDRLVTGDVPPSPKDR